MDTDRHFIERNTEEHFICCIYICCITKSFKIRPHCCVVTVVISIVTSVVLQKYLQVYL